MRSKANWCMGTVIAMMVLIVAVALMSCGKGGNLPSDQLSVSGVKSASPVQISEDEIGTLPQWQQELLSDPGWNQPYIKAREGTPVEAPSVDELAAATGKALAEGVELSPRFMQDTAKGASWIPGAQTAQTIAKGEYNNLARGATPPFGCNGDGNNESPAHNAIEDLISNNADVMPTYRVSFVSEGLAPVNYFNTTAGVNKGQSAAVYQAFASQENINWATPLSQLIATTDFAEINYRSSLVPSGAPNGGCNTGSVSALAVKGFFWYAFNSNLTATPSMSPIPAYHVLIAAKGAEEGPFISSGATTGRKQEFYFGTVSACYGGAWIIGLTASNSSCAKFKDYFSVANYNGTAWYRPVYGILLKRWDDAKVPGAEGPWKSDFGWPVYGPTAYANGAQQLGVRGTYYQWGMWFERGFIWWVDYDNGPGGAYPNVPDEAQAYKWTGKNVYCSDEKNAALVKLAPTTFYGGSGPLGVSVAVDAYRNTATDPWSAVDLNDSQTEYHIALPSGDGLATVMVKMTAGGYGGTAGTDPGHPEWGSCLYKYYVWAFRDGTIQPALAPFDPTQRSAVHTYGDLALNKESVYVVRVQVTDANNTVAYGDSLPIVLGHGGGGGGGGGEIMLIRDDAPSFSTYQTNYDALKADLDEIGALYSEVNYSDTVAADFEAGGYKVAIWYRGGPGAAGEPDYTTNWTAQEEANFNELLKKKMFLVSQAHGAVSTVWWWSYWGWDSDPDSQHCSRINATPMTHATDQNMGLTSNEDNGVFGWLYVMMGSEMGKGGSATPLQRGGLPGVYGSAAAERVGATLANGSGTVPTSFQYQSGTSVKQFCARGWYPPFGSSWINAGFKNGILANPSGSGGWDDGNYGAAMLSYGCSSTGGAAWNVPGAGLFWCWSWAYTDMTVTGPAGMARSEVLQNTLAWLDQSLTFSGGAQGGAGGSFNPYEGNPEVVTVTPGYWDATGYHVGQTSITGTHYPDRDFSVSPPVEWAGTDAYRTTLPLGASANNRYVVTATASNDGTTPNDVDFQFPWYGYIKDVSANGVGTGATGSAGGATDDTIVYRGLLLDDADANWARYTPAAGQTPLCVLNMADPDPTCAAYFVSTLGNATGDTGDEVLANYGQGIPAFTWNNANKLEAECVAHWPATLDWGAANPPKIYWSMFPGHGMRVPGTTTLLVDTPAAWESFRTIYDIDPTFPAAWNGVARDTTAWNRGVFSFTSALAEGRVVSFDYRKIKNWNGDLNRNGVSDQPDKFPIRARMISNYSAYTTVGNWPDHEPLWDLDPTLSTFSEGGSYVVDNGAPVYMLQMTDDPAYPNPGSLGPPITFTFVGNSGIYKQWTVNCGYLLKFGTPSYQIQYRVGTDLDGPGPGALTWGAWTNGTNRAAAGAYIQQVTCIGTPSVTTFNVQIRGTDNNVPPTLSTYTGWASFSLTIPYVFAEDFETGGSSLGTNSWSVVYGPYGSQFVNRATSAYGGAPQSGSRCAGTQPYVGSTLHVFRSGPYTCSAGVTKSFTFYLNGYSESYWDGLIVGYSFNNISWTYLGSYTIGRSWYKNAFNGYIGSSWSQRSYNITPTSNQIWIQIGFTSDSIINYTGTTIDNMKIM